MNIRLTQIISIWEVERNQTGKNQMSQSDYLNFWGLTKHIEDLAGSLRFEQLPTSKCESLKNT